MPVAVAPTVGTLADVDPFALAGIRRAATVAELTRMGVIATPAERIGSVTASFKDTDSASKLVITTALPTQSE